MNDAEHKATFIVIGGWVLYSDRVALKLRDGGCRVNATILKDGADNPDWRQFHHRVARSLAKLQAAKVKPV